MESIFVTAEHAGRRLDQALAALLPRHSRSRLQGWIRRGRVLVNGAEARPRSEVRAGDRIDIDADTEPVETDARPENILLQIIHEDAAILVLNKPAGLIVHPGAGNPGGTLLNALLHHDGGLISVPRAGIVQRLDKDTSGIMVVARTPAAHTRLVAEMARRAIRREYLAIVNGVVTAGGTVAAALGRHAGDRTRMTVKAAGRHAVTHYRVLERFRAHTLLRVTLETGRTHQIRVHLAHIHHPVVGDPVYGRRRMIPGGVAPELGAAVLAFPRQALHATKLGLEHPLTGLHMDWSVPLPDDMQMLLDQLRRHSAV
ncbi:MAG: 23S rRNA pseudouridine(1911/1915/1917) synthase RluD [Gammaproteobacteria bacterium]|nr:23S rRNA pseudouridine(1911/1915/1917) synthase RluD [Gammaproteobacteria bacterium]